MTGSRVPESSGDSLYEAMEQAVADARRAAGGHDERPQHETRSPTSSSGVRQRHDSTLPPIARHRPTPQTVTEFVAELGPGWVPVWIVVREILVFFLMFWPAVIAVSMIYSDDNGATASSDRILWTAAIASIVIRLLVGAIRWFVGRQASRQ